MADDSLIEEMRAAVRGDRERAQRRKLAEQSPERQPAQAALAPETRRPEPVPEPALAEPQPEVEPAPPRGKRRWFGLRRHAGS